MHGLTKYYLGFRLALINELIYRMNFLFGISRRVIFSMTLVYVFDHIPQGIGALSSEQLVAYTLVSYVISSLIHVYCMGGISDDIVSGDLSNYLVKPIRFLPYWAARMAATRLMVFVSSAVGFLAVWLVSSIPLERLFIVANPVQTVLLCVGAMIIVQLLDFLGGMLAFWTTDEHGMQWLLMTAILFLSGALIPINVLPDTVQAVLKYTPFPSLVYAPTQMYLGHFDEAAFLHALFVQCVWILLCAAAVIIFWQRGARSYEAYGR